MTRHTVDWIDRHREPREAPDPRAPLGVDIDASRDAEQSCTVELAYPAKRIGYYVVSCQCGARIILTTAGRPDDPRSVKLACKQLREDEE